MDEKIRILYAEDNVGWASMVCELLDTAGFQVEVACNGDVAWERFQKSQPDMVLLDIDMPGKNGWELIRAFKKENEWIPVVLYSALYDSSKLDEALGLGAEDFLNKTCQPEELVNRLQAFHARAVARRGKTEVFNISGRITFQAGSDCLMTGEKKEILKRNESKLLRLLCLQMDQEVKKKDLCEGIWNLYNETKEHALKMYITKLRRILSGDPSVQIVNKRWGGYTLVRQPEK